MNIKNISRFGRSFSIVRVPYSFKLLMQELEAMNIQMRIITDENVDQLLGMSYSNNIQKLLKTDNATLQEAIQKYTSEVNNILRSGSEKRIQNIVEAPDIPAPIEKANVEPELSLLQPDSGSNLSPQYPDVSPAYVPPTPTSSQANSLSPGYIPATSPATSPAYYPSSQNTPPPNSQAIVPVANLQLQQPLQNLQQSPNIVLAQPLMQGVSASPIIIQQPFVTAVPLQQSSPTQIILPQQSSSPPLESILNVEEAKTENNPQEKSESSSENVEKKVAFNVASDSGDNSSSSNSNTTKKITL
jgi:hypothetical protein